MEEDEYAVCFAIKKKDGTITLDMTPEEMARGKYQEYGVTYSQIKIMFFKYHKTLTEAAEKNIELNLKTDNSSSKSA